MERTVVVASIEEFHELYPGVRATDYEVGQFGVQVWFNDNSEQYYNPQSPAKNQLYVVVSHDGGAPLYVGEKGHYTYNVDSAKRVTMREARGMVNGIMRANNGRRAWGWEKV